MTVLVFVCTTTDVGAPDKISHLKSEFSTRIFKADLTCKVDSVEGGSFIFLTPEVLTRAP